MLITQHRIAIDLYDFGRWQDPMSRFFPPYRSWQRYARRNRSSRGYWGGIDPTAEAIFTRRNGNFPSLLASYTAQLEYEGKTLFAIQKGLYTEGDYIWSGPVDENRAFTIRSADEQQAAIDFYFPDDDWDGDYDWSYSMTYVVAPNSFIE